MLSACVDPKQEQQQAETVTALKAEITKLNSQITDLETQLETALNRATFSEGQIASIKAILTPEEATVLLNEPEEELSSENVEIVNKLTSTSKPSQSTCEIEDECPVTDTPETVESVDSETTANNPSKNL